MLCCKCCDKAYIGRYVQYLRARMNQHRAKFYSLLEGKDFDLGSDDADDFPPELHLVEYGLKNRNDSDEHYQFYILGNCSP